jgi:S1-C subfamily serine protease
VAAVVILVALVVGLRTRPSQAPPRQEAVAEPPKAVVAPPAAKRTSAQILADAMPAVARLRRFEISGQAVPVGLALAVAPGSMVTTCHGLPAGAQLVATVGAETHSAGLALTDEVLDLCRLDLADFNGKPLALATEEPKLGDTLYALGANAAGEFALTEGTVRHFHKQPQGNVIEISIPIAPTASGGPVFDAYGKVVGIATTPHAYGPTINAVLPATWISEMRSRGK